MYIYIYRGFHKWGYPKMDGLQWKIPLKMMIKGTPIAGNLHIFICIFAIYIYIILYIYIHTTHTIHPDIRLPCLFRPAARTRSLQDAPASSRSRLRATASVDSSGFIEDLWGIYRGLMMIYRAFTGDLSGFMGIYGDLWGFMEIHRDL